MWYELVEMVEQRCLCDQLPRQHRARAAILLYGSLVNCEEAFTRYKQNHSDAALANTVFTVDSFISTLHNLDSILLLFEPELKARLDQYSLGESRSACFSKPKELLKTQVELLHSTVNAEVEAISLLANDLSDFTGAKKRLAHFITATFSFHELFELP